MPITKLMEGLPSRSMPQVEFDEASEKLMSELPPWGIEANALAADVNAKQIAAADSATAAQGYRNTALTYRDQSQAYRDTTLTYRDQSQAYRDGAIAARDAAQNYAAALTATSTTSLVIGVGTKVFATQAGKQFTANQTLKAVNPADATQYMVGTVTYGGSTLTMLVTDVNPATSGNTVANWVISLSGEKGATGATGGATGGNLTGALNELRAPDVAISATPDIWSGAGNLVRLVGDGTVTNFAVAPQNGASRTVLAVGTITLTNGANLVVFGGTRTVTAGDILDVVAENTSRCRVSIKKENGTAVVVQPLRYLEITSSQSWSIPVADFVVELWGGGPGGNSAVTGGSGAPGYCKKTFNGATIGASATIVIGAGGAGAAGNNTADTPPALGTNGTASTFTLTGFTTLTANPGLVPLTAGASIPGAGGTASGGDINLTGSYGCNAILTIQGGDTQGFGMDGGSTYMCNGGASLYRVDGLQGSGPGAPGGSGMGKVSAGANTGRYAGAAGRAGACRIWY